MRTVRSKKSGYCPEQDRTYVIEVCFAEVPILGETNRQYKKTSFYCEFCEDNGCKSCGGTGGDCPIFKAAENP